jgi:uncharacterized membrane protein (DUF373 family)
MLSGPFEKVFQYMFYFSILSTWQAVINCFQRQVIKIFFISLHVKELDNCFNTILLQIIIYELNIKCTYVQDLG